MTPGKIHEVVGIYRVQFEKERIPKTRMDARSFFASKEEMLAHAHYLLDGIEEYAKDPDKKGKCETPPVTCYNTAMVRAFLNAEIRLWAAILILFAVVGGSVAIIRYSSSIPYVNVIIPEEAHFSGFSYGAHPQLANADIFRTVKEKLLAEQIGFIEADLSSMTLRVYKGGVETLTVPIKSKGREGSWWETPSGIYRAEGKEKNHFSSLGRVYMPWSIPFQGNFFIHGWPYYPDGTPVSTSYSGGCIRLATNDAEQVYALVSPNMPILVHESDNGSNGFSYEERGPVVTASSVLVADLKNNFVLYEKNSSTQAPIASITKLVTAIVATEFMNIEREIEITDAIIATTSIMRLAPGNTHSVYDLLFILLQESSNEAALAISRPLGPDRFISLLNDKARALGMNQTAFSDPAGINAGNMSSPQDLFILAQYLYNNRKFILDISAGITDTRIYGAPDFRNIQNLNLFSHDQSFIGGKVGYSSSADNTGLFLFSISVGDEVRPVAIILLGSQDLFSDTKNILSHITSSYTKAALSVE